MEGNHEQFWSQLQSCGKDIQKEEAYAHFRYFFVCGGIGMQPDLKRKVHNSTEPLKCGQKLKDEDQDMQGAYCKACATEKMQWGELFAQPDEQEDNAGQE